MFVASAKKWANQDLLIMAFTVVVFIAAALFAGPKVYVIFTPDEMLNDAIDLLFIVEILIAFVLDFVDVGDKRYLNHNLDSEILNERASFRQFGTKSFRLFLYLIFIIPLILMLCTVNTKCEHLLVDAYVAFFVGALLVLLDTLYSSLGLLDARRDSTGHDEYAKSIVRKNIFSSYQRIVRKYLLDGKDSPIDYVTYTISSYNRNERIEYLTALFDGEYANANIPLLQTALAGSLTSSGTRDRRMKHYYDYLKDKWGFLATFDRQHNSDNFAFLQDQLDRTTRGLRWVATNLPDSYLSLFTGQPIDYGDFAYSKSVDRIFCYAQTVINNSVLNRGNLEDILTVIAIETTRNNYKVLAVGRTESSSAAAELTKPAEPVAAKAAAPKSSGAKSAQSGKRAKGTKTRTSVRSVVNNTNTYTYELGLHLFIRTLNSNEYLKQVNRGNYEDFPAELAARARNNRSAIKNASRLDSSYLEILENEQLKNDVALCSVFSALTLNSQIVYLLAICSKYIDGDAFCRPLVTNFLFFNKAFTAHIVNGKIVNQSRSADPADLATRLAGKLASTSLTPDNVTAILMALARQDKITVETYRTMKRNNFGFLEYLLLRIMFTSVSAVDEAIPTEPKRFFEDSSLEETQEFHQYIAKFRSQYGTRLTKIMQKLFDL